MAEPTLDEQIEAVRAEAKAWADYDATSSDSTAADEFRVWSAILATLQRHKRAMAVVEAARAYNDSPKYGLGHRDLEFLHNIDIALAAFDAETEQP